VAGSSLRQKPNRAVTRRPSVTDYGIDGNIAQFCLLAFRKSVLSLPDGVIGNTRVFGTLIPGSSPGRVGLSIYC
jgi:hypothetical protein